MKRSLIHRKLLKCPWDNLHLPAQRPSRALLRLHRAIRAHAQRCEPSSHVHVIYASRPTRGRRAVAESTPQKTIFTEAPDWWLAGRSLPAQPANWRAKRHPSPHPGTIGWASRRRPGRRRTSTPSVGAEDHTHATRRYSLIGSGPWRVVGRTTFRGNYPRCSVLGYSSAKAAGRPRRGCRGSPRKGAGRPRRGWRGRPRRGAGRLPGRDGGLAGTSGVRSANPGSTAAEEHREFGAVTDELLLARRNASRRAEDIHWGRVERRGKRAGQRSGGHVRSGIGTASIRRAAAVSSASGPGPDPINDVLAWAF
jgi:hypothetical protein